MPESAVQISDGILKGVGGEVRSFKGIPFAAPPVGPLRWRLPQPVVPWKGERDATSFGDDCMQAPSVSLRGRARSEDCLTLNVWTPAKHEGEALPVMVWVPGGGFVGGSGSDVRADGEALARKGVVVVTINYRTGLFGWLAHPELQAESEHNVAGNYGLMDQIAALQWVQKNIAAFGGDSNRVTVSGVSAGGAAIVLLMISPFAKGLLHQVILESSGAFRPLSRLDEANEAGLKAGASLEELRRLSTDELFERTSRLVPKVRGLTTGRVLRPICDGVYVPSNDRAAFNAGNFARVPMIVGTNVDEGTNFTASWPVNTCADFEALLNREFGDVAAQAAHFYPVTSDADVKPQLANLFGDLQFNYGAWGVCRAAEQFGLEAYRYLFSHHPGGRSAGMRHGEEVSYVFGNVGTVSFEDGEQSVDDHTVAGHVMEAWANFAKTGKPSLPHGPDWVPYTQSTDEALRIEKSLGSVCGWRGAQMQFIDGFFEKRGA